MIFKKRPTRRLAEIIDSDLLTATEKLVKNEVGGFYCLADESAYFKTSGDKANMSITEFEAHLKKNVHQNFFIVFNPKKLPPHKVEGHQIGFYVDAYKGFVPICKVGRNADKMIPANSKGRVVKYDGASSRRTDGVIKDEEAVLYRGWVAAEEACKRFIEDATKFGITAQRCITPKEFFEYKKVVEMVDGEAILSNFFSKARKKSKEVEEQIAKAEEERIKKEKEIEQKAIDYVKENTTETKPDAI